MRVLVDGDRGYIGAVLVPLLLEAGHDVEGLDAGWYDGCDFGPQPDGYERRRGDIRTCATARSARCPAWRIARRSASCAIATTRAPTS